MIGRLAGDALEDVVGGLEHLGHLVVHVRAEDEDLAFEAGGLDGQRLADGAAFVGRPEQVDVGVGLEHGLGDGLGLVGQPAGLVGDDLDAGQLGHLGHEAFLARRAALELVAVERADDGLAAELLGDELGCGRTGGGAEVFVLGDQEAGGDAGLADAGVEADDGDAGVLGLLQCGQRAVGRDRRDDDGIDPAGDVVVDHAAFLGQVVLGVAQDQLSAGGVSRGLHAGLHGLHEGVALEHDAGEGLALGLGHVHSAFSGRDLKDRLALGIDELLDHVVHAAAEEDRRGVRYFGYGLACQHLHRRLERIVAHLVGRLAGDALKDVVGGLEHLGHLVVHVRAEDEDLALQAGGLDGQRFADGAAFVGRPEQVDVGVGLEHGLGDGLGLVGQPAGLVGDDLDAGQLGHFGHEAFLARRATLELVAVERADDGLAAELLGDELGRGHTGGGAEVFVLGHQEGGGDAGLADAGVEADDGDAGVLGLLQCGHRTVG